MSYYFMYFYLKQTGVMPFPYQVEALNISFSNCKSL